MRVERSAPGLGLFALAAALSGCTITQPPPPDLVALPDGAPGRAGQEAHEPAAAPPAEPASDLSREPAERAALLERLRQREEELARWKGAAGDLRATLEVARKETRDAQEALAVARADGAKAVAARDAAEVRAVAAEQARRGLELELARQELEAIRRERQALELELARHITRSQEAPTDGPAEGEVSTEPGAH